MWGLERGYCLMIGGSDEAVASTRSAAQDDRARASATSRAPRAGTASRRRRSRATCTAGRRAPGHFVKMVHNGIEYGIMAAYAEGLNILDNADAGIRAAEHSAEIAPLGEPEYYQFDIDTPKVAEVWRRGSVIASWLLDLTAAALQANPNLDGLAGRVSDSGEGRWTVKAAIDIGVPAPVLSAALYERFASAARTTSPTRCCRRCASSSAATTSCPPATRSRPAPGTPRADSARDRPLGGSQERRSDGVWCRDLGLIAL